jgi:hypothetical protein
VTVAPDTNILNLAANPVQAFAPVAHKTYFGSGDGGGTMAVTALVARPPATPHGASRHRRAEGPDGCNNFFRRSLKKGVTYE